MIFLQVTKIRFCLSAPSSALSKRSLDWDSDSGHMSDVLPRGSQTLKKPQPRRHHTVGFESGSMTTLPRPSLDLEVRIFFLMAVGRWKQKLCWNIFLSLHAITSLKVLIHLGATTCKNVRKPFFGTQVVLFYSFVETGIPTFATEAGHSFRNKIFTFFCEVYEIWSLITNLYIGRPEMHIIKNDF